MFYFALHACRELTLGFVRLVESILLHHILIIINDVSSQAAEKLHKGFGARAISNENKFCQSPFSLVIFNALSKQSFFYPLQIFGVFT